MERWGYVALGPESKTRRDGYGSARPTLGVGRPLHAGEALGQRSGLRSQEEIEARWRDRFGARGIDELRRPLEAVVSQLDVDLPECFPIVVSANGMVADLPVRERRSPPPRHFSALLSQVLVAYTFDFERESELSLSLSANLVRVWAREAWGCAAAATVGSVWTSCVLPTACRSPPSSLVHEHLSHPYGLPRRARSEPWTNRMPSVEASVR